MGARKRQSSESVQAQTTDAVVLECKVVEAMTPLDRSLHRLQLVHERLGAASTPSVLACREHEQDTIRQFIETCFDAAHGDSLYVCGSPGTGKTASVDALLRTMAAEYQRLHSPRFLSVNAMHFPEPRSLIAEILRQLGRDLQQSLPLDKLMVTLLQALMSSKRMIVLCVDEIDGLLRRAPSATDPLQCLFTWPQLEASPLVLLGIANSIDLVERFLPRLGPHFLQTHKPLVFKPYTRDDLGTIVHQRLQEISSALGTPEDLPQCSPTKRRRTRINEAEDSMAVKSPIPQHDLACVFDTVVVEYFARKIAAGSGDVRKCLDLCRQSLALVIEEVKGGTLDPDHARVELKHATRVASDSMASRVIAVVKNLTTHQKLLLCAVAACVVRAPKLCATEGAFRNFYTEQAKRLSLPLISCSDDFNDCMAVLSGCGFVERRLGAVGSARGKRVPVLALKVQVADIEYALCKDVSGGPFAALLSMLRNK